MSPRSPALALRILIVDDEADNRELLELILQFDGFLTLTAACGEEALAIVARERPDLVLLDIMMPGMSGYEVMAQIKGTLDTENIPVVIVTAMNDRATKMRALRAGANDVLVKPMGRLELCGRVRSVLGLKAAGA